MSAEVVSKEQIKLLGELSQGQTVFGDRILTKAPEWSQFERAGILPPGSTDILSSLHTYTPYERCDHFASDPGLIRALLDALHIESDKHAVQYALYMIYDIVRSDTSRYDSIVDFISDTHGDANRTFSTLLDANTAGDTFTADKAAFLLSGMMSRAKYGMFSQDQISYFVRKVVSGQYKLSDSGRLEALTNILKNDAYRDLCWNTRGLTDVLFKGLDVRSPVPVLYHATFSVWLLTFNKKFLAPLFECGMIRAVCRVLKHCKTEKIIRLTTRILVNALQTEAAVELIIEENSVQILTLLEYEKWRDDDTYTEIQNGLTELQGKIRQFSNFDRYLRELNKGKLKWSFLHSEKFWHENVMHFEDNQFEAIKKLVGLLKEKRTDVTTLSVACYDLGEFARLHPTGKQTLQKLQVKAVVMMLMSHKEREVAREALLCTQKMMLDRWQAAAGTQ